jgi:hypothetical protein
MIKAKRVVAASATEAEAGVARGVSRGSRAAEAVALSERGCPATFSSVVHSTGAVADCSGDYMLLPESVCILAQCWVYSRAGACEQLSVRIL